MRKRKSCNRPHKLAEIFASVRSYCSQNGAAASAAAVKDGPPLGNYGLDTEARSSSLRSGQASSQVSPPQSPQESRPRLDPILQGTDVEEGEGSLMEETRDPNDPITQFPTTGKPIVDTTLKI